MSGDVLIILGGGINPLTQEINEITKIRFDKAIDIHTNFKYILCVGDKSYKKDLIKGVQISEAQAGKKYLLQNSTISQDEIILEEESKDTLSNAFYSRKLIEEQNLGKNITIITSQFHMKKTKFFFNFVFDESFKLGFIEVENSFTNEKELKRREISEKLVLEFHQIHLEKTYSITPHNMYLIKLYIEKINPATSGNIDKYHEKLTQRVEEEAGSIHNVK